MSEPRLDLPDDVADAQLEQYREQFENGFGDALFHALLFCGKCGKALPDWVVRESHKSWHEFVKRDAETLGEAFGIQHPKGSHKAAYKKKRGLKFQVYSRIKELNHTRPIDEQLFSDVGKEFYIGKKLASEYYYSVKAVMDTMKEAP